MAMRRRAPEEAAAEAEARRGRERVAAFSAMAVGMAVLALSVVASYVQRPEQAAVSLPGQAPAAEAIAKARWGFDKPVDMVDAPGIKTAKALLQDGRCTIWRDGDAASVIWWRARRSRSGLYVDLHEMAHCQEQATPGFERRMASATADDFARAREVYADAMAFSAMAGKDPKNSFLPGFAKMKRPEHDPHDGAFAANCLLTQASDTGSSDEQKASKCADLAAQGVFKMAKL